MYNTFYTCDCCGKQMDKPDIVLTTRKDNFLSIEDRVNFIENRDTWHYCDDCWKEIKNRLIGRDSENVEKLKEEIDRLKKENKRLQGIVDWWNSIFIVLTNDAIKQEKEKRNSSSYTTYTINSGGEKTVQANPVGDGPFTVGCCCENSSKDSLNYRQTTAPYSSLR